MACGRRTNQNVFMRQFYAIICLGFLFPAIVSNAQNVTVNPGSGSYTTLKAAFDAINAGTHTGVVTVTVVANTTETATATLNASGTGAASYTSLSILPTGTVTVSGNLAAPLVSLSGADNVTINGLNTGGNRLTFSNTSTSAVATTSTIRLINDASNNTITNCVVLGSNTSAANTTTATGNILLSTATSTGNDNNTISNNDIGPAGSNLPARGIASFGSSSGTNSGVNVTNI
jgi:trimeric autotransporter adhesin